MLLMAGRGPVPKPYAAQHRRNRRGVPVALDTARETTHIPALPNPDKRKWHRLTLSWWRMVWRSPMAPEYLETDVIALGRLAILIDQFYVTGDARLMPEIRQQEARFGLSPVDRRRLQWEVAKGEDAERRRRPAVAVQRDDDDVDAYLRAIK
jgi:hypothetical protein